MSEYLILAKQSPNVAQFTQVIFLFGATYRFRSAGVAQGRQRTPIAGPASAPALLGLFEIGGRGCFRPAALRGGTRSARLRVAGINCLSTSTMNFVIEKSEIHVSRFVAVRRNPVRDLFKERSLFEQSFSPAGPNSCRNATSGWSRQPP
jgi:hypothetical protein